MVITAQTKVHDLLEAYPYMKEWLVSYSSEFTKLDNPVIYNTVGRFASLETAASMAEKDVDTFLDDVRTAVAQREIMAEESAGAAKAECEPGASPTVAEMDSAERRQETLKSVIRRLHDGASVDEVKRDFDLLVAEVDSAEIARMEQALIAEGMPVSDVQRLCDVHVKVFKESLDEKPESQVAAGHPVDHYQRENVIIGEIVGKVRCALDSLETTADADGRPQLVADLSAELEQLSEIETHYLRKENQLFPVLEKHGVEGPTKVMWAIDDDIRGRLKTARALIAQKDVSSVIKILPELLGMIEDMVYKEEKILLPTALQVVTAAEWDEMAAGDAHVGFAWTKGEGSIAERAAVAASPSASEGPMLLPLPTGALTLEQLDLLFRALPFDLTYVDEQDRVRFYSEGERVFTRSPAAIGRQVRNCHPPKSLEKVEQILAEFKAGSKDVAEFWIEMGERFIHIRYFALRDENGIYRGTLETVQDATHLRSLTGQRRIVDW